jgi:hypothetical protein
VYERHNNQPLIAADPLDADVNVSFGAKQAYYKTVHETLLSMASMLQSGDPNVNTKDYADTLQLYYTKIETDILLVPYLKKHMEHLEKNDAYVLASRFTHILHLDEFVSYIRVVDKLIRVYKPRNGNNVIQNSGQLFPTIRAENLVVADKFAPLAERQFPRPADKKPCGCKAGVPCAGRNCGCHRDGFGCIPSCGC